MRRDAMILNWVMVPTAIALIVLLALSLLRLRRDGVDLQQYRPTGPREAPSTAAHQTRQFFGWPSTVHWLPLTNASNPFFTLAIQPPPPPKPPAPPPSTRKIDVTYRGFFETSAGVRRAVVQVADQQVLAGRGDKVVGDYLAGEIELRHLNLTNAAGQSVRFEFAKTQPLEVPAK